MRPMVLVRQTWAPAEAPLPRLGGVTRGPSNRGARSALSHPALLSPVAERPLLIRCAAELPPPGGDPLLRLGLVLGRRELGFPCFGSSTAV